MAWGVWAVAAARLARAPSYVAIISMDAVQGAPPGGAIGLPPCIVGPLIALALGLVGTSTPSVMAEEEMRKETVVRVG